MLFYSRQNKVFFYVYKFLMHDLDTCDGCTKTNNSIEIIVNERIQKNLKID